MSILIRKMRLSGSTLVETSDMEFEADELSLGSAGTCDVQLFGDDVAANHLRLRAEGGAANFECRGNALVALAGEDRRNGRLSPGEEIDIGGNRLRVIDAPPGFQLALELSVDAEQELSSRVRLASELGAAVPATRWLSYLLAALVLVLGLALPIYAYWQQPVETAWQRADVMWETGPLLRAHQTPAIGDDCGVCHVAAFSPVPDETCLGCHRDTRQHHSGHAGLAFDDGSCLACHREHSEPEAMLISGAQLCVSCHQSAIHAEVSDRQVVAVTGFSSATHPEFSLSMLQFSADDRHWAPKRIAPSAPVEEDSNLSFPHDLHLNPEKVSFDSGEGLGCVDCHSLREGGEHFEPITMENQCSSCHTLGLDVRFPGRRVPHAKPAEVRHYLEEYHTTRYAQLLGKTTRDRSVAPPRASDSPAPENCLRSYDVLSEKIVKCGIELADKEMQRLFTSSGCVECHQVEQQQVDNQSSWKVLPVRLTRDWYPDARFNHKPHLQLGEETTDAGCLSCHQADASAHSSDVLIPKRDNCLQCHSDDQHADNQRNAVALDCHDCHDFHREALPAMTPAAMGERVFWHEFKRKLGVEL